MRTERLLTAAQDAALEHVRRHARGRRDQARSTIADILKMCDVSKDRFDAAIARVKSQARIALHFHPDRADARGRTIAEALRDDGRYRSQYETRLSNGSVSAVPGGARDRWEELLFGSAYHVPRAADAERPKYGSLDLLGHPDGPSPRFGSCYLILQPAVSARATFTYRDSHMEPRERGTLDELDDVLAAMLSDAFSCELALGERGRPPALVARMEAHLAAPFTARFDRAPARNLDHYIEAQVHGDVELARDGSFVVADPSFRGSATGEALAALCDRHGLALHWHAGNELAVDAVPTDFRGATMPAVARRVARDGVVHARAIGDAARAVAQDPAALQELKLLWHVLVHHGRPARRS